MAEGLNADPLLTYIRTHYVFQRIPTYSLLLDALVRQLHQNPLLHKLVNENWEEFLRMFKAPRGPSSSPPVVAGMSPPEFSLREATDIERGLQDLPAESEPQRQGTTSLGGIQSSNRISIPTGNDEGPLLTFLRTLPEFQHIRQKSQLVDAVHRQLAQRNLLVQLIITQNKEEFMSLVTQGRSSAQPVQPPLGEATDVAGATAPSTSVTPRISQLQSEPDIHDIGLVIASVAESVEPPSGATNDKETEEKIELTRTVDLQCKICMGEQVRVVFLPCGHLVSCPTCAERIFDCPMCRKHVTGKVRIYLS